MVITAIHEVTAGRVGDHAEGWTVVGDKELPRHGGLFTSGADDAYSADPARKDRVGTAGLVDAGDTAIIAGVAGSLGG